MYVATRYIAAYLGLVVIRTIWTVNFKQIIGDIMQTFPHEYIASAQGKASDYVIAQSGNLAPIHIAEPKEFDGSGIYWSPEQLFVATVANCLILTFRAIANASNFQFLNLKCDATGMLDRIENSNRFTEINIDVVLHLQSKDDLKKGQRLLEKAENQCLIKNSITAETRFHNTFTIE